MHLKIQHINSTNNDIDKTTTCMWLRYILLHTWKETKSIHEELKTQQSKWIKSIIYAWRCVTFCYCRNEVTYPSRHVSWSYISFSWTPHAEFWQHHDSRRARSWGTCGHKQRGGWHWWRLAIARVLRVTRVTCVAWSRKLWHLPWKHISLISSLPQHTSVWNFPRIMAWHTSCLLWKKLGSR